MGKIRTRTLGLEDVEKEQKEEQKKRAQEKKIEKKKSKKTTDVLETSSPSEPLTKAGKKPEKEAAQLVDKKTTKKAQITQHKRGKKYETARKVIDKNKVYSITEAIQILKKIKFTNFDESVELHLNVLETGLKGEVELPYPTGKTVRVTIVDDKVIEKLEKGIIDFDVLIAHPSYMPKLAKHAKVLGPKGLMPNPKAGTVSPNPEQVAEKFSKGNLRWKTEPKFPLIHQMIGKISADEKNLVENAEAFLKSVATKNIKEAFIKSTMSPSLKLNLQNI